MDNIGKWASALSRQGSSPPSPLSGPKYRRRTLWSRQRVGNIASDVNTTTGQAFISSLTSMRARLSSAFAGGNLLVIFGRQFRPQRLYHPGAAVVRRAAADADNNLAHSGIQRMANQLAGPP